MPVAMTREPGMTLPVKYLWTNNNFSFEFSKLKRRRPPIRAYLNVSRQLSDRYCVRQFLQLDHLLVHKRAFLVHDHVWIQWAVLLFAFCNGAESTGKSALQHVVQSCERSPSASSWQTETSKSTLYW